MKVRLAQISNKVVTIANVADDEDKPTLQYGEMV